MSSAHESAMIFRTINLIPPMTNMETETNTNIETCPVESEFEQVCNDIEQSIADAKQFLAEGDREAAATAIAVAMGFIDEAEELLEDMGAPPPVED